MTAQRKIDSATGIDEAAGTGEAIDDGQTADIGRPDDDATGLTDASSAGNEAAPYSDPFGPDEIAPVDWQADPAHWLPGRSLWIVAGIILVLTIATVIVCLVIWSTPSMTPVKIPTIAKA